MTQPLVKLRRCPSLASGITSLLLVSVFATSDYRQVLRRQQLDVPVIIVLLLISAFFLFVEPIAQPQAYHKFADRRRCVCRCGGRGIPTMMFLPPDYPHDESGEDKSRKPIGRSANAGIAMPNFGDTASNIVILLGGICGVVALVALKMNGNANNGVGGNNLTPSEEWQLNVCLPVFFLATVAVSVGSTYYHWNPSDATLVWDRLPMTVAFAAIFCYMLDEYLPNESDINIRNERGMGQELLIPLIATGVGSVLYWSWTDDLRLYAVVSIFPMFLMIALVLFCSPPRHGGLVQQVIGLLLYAAAKVCEDRDHEIFRWTGRRISRHSLKHILAGLAPIAIAHMVLMRNIRL